MPKRKTAWSSWNFLSNNTVEKSFSLTYWMNLLQNLPNRKNFFESINPYILPNNYYDEVIGKTVRSKKTVGDSLGVDYI